MPHTWRAASLALSLGIGLSAPLMAQTPGDSLPTPPSSSMEEGDSGAQSLAAIRRVRDPDQRASLLLDLLQNCAPSDCPESPLQLLTEVTKHAAAVEEPARRVELLVRLARVEQRLGLADQAAATLIEARRTAEAMEGEAKASELLRVSLAYGALDQEEAAAALLAEAVSEPPGTSGESKAPFPFTPAPTEVDLGLAISGASYLDTTALASINLDLYRQAARYDLDVDLMVSADYDSSRDTNNVRPHSQIVLVVRHHLNRRWNLFFDQLVSINTDTFSSDNSDEDLSVLSGSFVGAGLNLWRGKDPSSFVEVQLGAGIRYEYESIDFQLRRNEVSPSPLLVLRSRELPLASGQLNQTLALGNSMLDWNNFFIWSSNQLRFPLSNSKKWWWTNELVLRYRNLPVNRSNPRVTALFSTGLTYSF